MLEFYGEGRVMWGSRNYNSYDGLFLYEVVSFFIYITLSLTLSPLLHPSSLSSLLYPSLFFFLVNIYSLPLPPPHPHSFIYTLLSFLSSFFRLLSFMFIKCIFIRIPFLLPLSYSFTRSPFLPSFLPLLQTFSFSPPPPTLY